MHQKNNAMMKLMDHIYFNIYRWYYKMKMDGRKVDPQGLTAMAFGLCFGGWFFVIDSIYPDMLHTLSSGYHKLALIIAVFLFAAVINEVYTRKDRVLKNIR